MSFLSQPPRIIGHRGAAGLFPENTLPSFAAAYALNVDAVELDVYAVEDELVVIHDDTLDRTTNLTGNVSSQTLSALRQADAGGGAPIPMLEEVWLSLPPTIGLNIELKGPNTAGPVADWLRHRQDALSPGRVMVSSFDHAELLRFATEVGVSHIITAPLFHRWKESWLEVASALDTKWINFNQKLLTAARMERLLKAEMQVSAYTVNSLRRARTLHRLGVGGLFTDRPDLVSRFALTG